MNSKIFIGLLVITLVGSGLLLIQDQNTPDQPHDEEHNTHTVSNVDQLTPKEPVRADGTFTISTSFYPLQFALDRIVGELAVVKNIGENQDPHDFRPSTQDILTLQQSDLVVLQGAEFEPWGHDVEDQLEAASVPVVIATAGLELQTAKADHLGSGEEPHSDEYEESNHNEDEYSDHHHEHDHGDYNPHTWLDPVLFSETVAYLTTALGTLDPENAETYTANATALQAELDTLNSDYTKTLASCALNETITSHDAFSYLAERYNFTIHVIAGLSTQDLPSAVTLAELRKEAEEGVGAILIEESNVTAYGETLAAETGLETLPANPIAYIIPENEDYLTLMRSNLNSFSTALQCTNG